jgi:ribosomal protein S18 acetylase RimI-like enzyme
MEYRYIEELSVNESLLEGVFGLLKATESEFVPPLHARSSTTQKDLGRGGLTDRLKEDNLRAYFGVMACQRFILALEGDSLQGFLSFRPDETMCIDGRVLTGHYISTISVHPGQRNKGIGTAMYRFLMKTMGEGCMYYTRTWETNTSHQAILIRLGFRLLAIVEEGRTAVDGTSVPSRYYMKD